MKGERDALKHDSDRYSTIIASALAELDTLRAEVEALELERSNLRLAFDHERDALEEKVTALEDKRAELGREFNGIVFIRNEPMEDRSGADDPLKAKLAQSDAALGETRFIVPETTLRQAQAQFECLAEEFNELGDIVSQVMCEVGARRMDRALIPAATGTDHLPDDQVALSILAQPRRISQPNS